MWTVALSLLRKHWPLVLLGLFATWASGVAAWRGHEIKVRDRTISVIKARLETAEALGRAQADLADKTQTAWINVTLGLVDDAHAKIAAIAADRTSLAGRLRDYENRLRAGEVPGTAAGPGGGADPAPQPGSADAALDDYDRACRIDAEWLSFWQHYAEAVGVKRAE